MVATGYCYPADLYHSLTTAAPPLTTPAQGDATRPEVRAAQDRLPGQREPRLAYAFERYYRFQRHDAVHA